MEDDRRTMESATDADASLGDFVSGLVEHVQIPRSSLVFEGEGESEFVDSACVMMRWSCRPE